MLHGGYDMWKQSDSHVMMTYWKKVCCKFESRKENQKKKQKKNKPTEKNQSDNIIKELT